MGSRVENIYEVYILYETILCSYMCMELCEYMCTVYCVITVCIVLCVYYYTLITYTAIHTPIISSTRFFLLVSTPAFPRPSPIKRKYIKEKAVLSPLLPSLGFSPPLLPSFSFSLSHLHITRVRAREGVRVYIMYACVYAYIYVRMCVRAYTGIHRQACGWVSTGGCRRGNLGAFKSCPFFLSVLRKISNGNGPGVPTCIPHPCLCLRYCF